MARVLSLHSRFHQLEASRKNPDIQSQTAHSAVSEGVPPENPNPATLARERRSEMPADSGLKSSLVRHRPIHTVPPVAAMPLNLPPPVAPPTVQSPLAHLHALPPASSRAPSLTYISSICFCLCLFLTWYLS
ncbi:hypothetical protein HAV15_004867 [Penicillium sp. str. |nr:hypothetical protein HAV15_004867 [Penicillium sp. str. \